VVIKVVRFVTPGQMIIDSCRAVNPGHRSPAPLYCVKVGNVHHFMIQHTEARLPSIFLLEVIIREHTTGIYLDGVTDYPSTESQLQQLLQIQIQS